MGDKVRLGSIGLGWWGNVLAEAAAASGEAEVVTCFARTPDTRNQFAARHDCDAAASVDELFDGDIDGVLVATPHTTHGDLIRRAAKAGKHVLVDKPMTLTVADADASIAAAAEAGIVLQVGHNKRRQSAIRLIKEMVDDGSLGTVLHVSANHAVGMLYKPDLPDWRQRRDELPAGGMTPLGVHQVDTFHYWAGPIARVSAFSTKRLTGNEIDDTTSIIFEFASGALGRLYTSVAHGKVLENDVQGTEQSVWNLEDGQRLEVVKRGESERTTIPVDANDTILEEVTEFAAAIRGETTPETGGAEGRAVVAVLEAIVESAATGRSVDVVS